MDLLSTLALMLEEQRKTNHLLLMLIEAMGEEDSDPDDEPQTYMDGSPVAGYQPRRASTKGSPPGDE